MEDTQKHDDQLSISDDKNKLDHRKQAPEDFFHSFHRICLQNNSLLRNAKLLHRDSIVHLIIYVNTACLSWSCLPKGRAVVDFSAKIAYNILE